MSDRFILTGGMICDGTGQDAFQGELLVENGVIQQVRRVSPLRLTVLPE